MYQYRYRSPPHLASLRIMSAKQLGSLTVLLVLMAGCWSKSLDYINGIGPSYVLVQPTPPSSDYAYNGVTEQKSDAFGSEAAPSQAKDFRSDYEYNEEAGGWFKFHDIPATWEDARFNCHAEGGVLASPLTNELKAAILSFVKQQSKGDDMFRIFSGVHATFARGDYSSIEGVPLRQLAVSWAAGEPDNYNNAESCLVMNINGAMADERCEEVLPYVCYKKYANLSITECGTSDPKYILSSKTGSCYKFHGRSLIWSDAFKTCEAEGAHLAVINSETEAKVIKDIFHKQPASSISTPKHNQVLAIGFRDMGVHQNFMTIHGETLEEAGFNKWHTGNPDNLTNTQTGDLGEFCGSILWEDGLLNDFYCNVPTPFICEKNPKSLRPDATWEDFIENKHIKQESLDDNRQDHSSEEESSTVENLLENFMKELKLQSTYQSYYDY